MIVILDYGVGNLKSIQNMIRKAGGEAVISSNKELVAKASTVILPGVGAFDHGMEKLHELGFVELLKNLVYEKGVMILGVCLGMQLLFERSEEGSLDGLGFIKGTVKRFQFKKEQNLKVPHMGWNIVNPIENAFLYKNLPNNARFYFVHSFYVECEREQDILATASYGLDFACSVNSGNVFGAQFHPEKSHKFGMQFFKNFLEYINASN